MRNWLPAKIVTSRSSSARVGGQRGQQHAAVGTAWSEALQVDQRPVGIGRAGQRSSEMRQQPGHCAVFRRRPGQAAQMPSAAVRSANSIDARSAVVCSPAFRPVRGRLLSLTSNSAFLPGRL